MYGVIRGRGIGERGMVRLRDIALGLAEGGWPGGRVQDEMPPAAVRQFHL